MAMAGPMPMISGGHPTAAKARNTAWMGRRCLLAKERRASSTHAAPSVIWLALPAHMRCNTRHEMLHSVIRSDMRCYTVGSGRTRHEMLHSVIGSDKVKID